MANTIKPKRSYTAAATPTCAAGELAINAADGKIWIGNAGGTANVLIASLSRGDHTGTLAATAGGTGQTTYATGDTLYASAANTLSKLSGNTSTTRKFLRQTGNGTASAAPAWDTVTKTDVGLANVENTALSTWAGSSSLTTLGTLSGLTVSGTVNLNALIYPAVDGTAGQVLSTNGLGTLSWASAAIPSGSTGDVQYADGSGGLTSTSYFSYGSSAYDKLAIYSTTSTDNVVGVFAASGQTGNLLTFRDYLGTTTYTYFDATGNLYLNAQNDVRFADADSSNYAAIQAPATISTNYTLTLPTTAGTSNYVLKTDGSGNLSWTNGISNLLGGGAGQLPYNTASGATSFLAAGTSGQVLRSNGTSAPAWEAQGLFSGGRLTLTSATPITTANVTGATTLYYTPYAGDKISLYDGTNWATYTFTERSLALGTLTSGLNYDVFLYNNAGTLTLELAAWTNDTTRTTALVLTNGIYLKSGVTTRRYLGTIRTTSTTATEDSIAKRFVWNFNNRVEKALYKNGTTSHTYTTASWRNWNNDATLRVEFVLGLDAAQVIHFGGAATGTSVDVGAGFDGSTPGYDSVNSTGTGVSQARGGRAYSSRGTFLGYHYCQMQEYGASGTTFLDARLEGTIWC